MIVCHCFAVNDRRITELVGSGAASVADVRAACGASSDCGSCANTIRSLVSERAGSVVAVAV